MTEIKQFSPLITIIIIIVHWSQLKQIILLVLYHWMFDCRWPFHEYVHNIYINIKWLSNDVSFTKEEILEIFGFIVPWNVIFFDLVVEYKLYRIHGIDLCRPHFRTSRIIFILSYVDKNILMNILQASRVEPTISIHMLAISWILLEPCFMIESNFSHRNSVSKLMDSTSLLFLSAPTILWKCLPKYSM